MNKLEKVDMTKLMGKSFKKVQMTPREIADFEINSYNSMKIDNKEDLDCPKCLNREDIAYWDDEEERIKYTVCECKAKRANLRRIRLSGLSKIIEKCTFEKYNTNSEWQNKVKTKAYNNSQLDKWFYIGGQTGAGKTHLCTAICKSLIDQGQNVLYMLWRDEISKLKAMVNTPEYFEEIKKIKNMQVLYIDDFFKVEQGKMPTQSDVNIAWEILNYRYNENLKTIISTELLLTEIEDIDGSTAGRIIEKATREYCVNIAKDKNKNHRTRDTGDVF